mgnify:CR=1 FL=1
MICELDVVALTHPVPEYSLDEGDVGTVVMVHQGGEAYEVEFVTLRGETLAVVTVPSATLRPVGEREIAHAREVA